MSKNAVSNVEAMLEDEQVSKQTPAVAAIGSKVEKKKARTTKKHRYLKSLGIVRPPTDFQLWGESVKEELRADIEAGSAPPEREAALKASTNENGRCNLNVYRGKLWKPVEQGGFGYLTPKQREHWQQEYQIVREEWQSRREVAMKDYPKRPPTAYFLFYERDFIKPYLEEHPDTPLTNIAIAASKVWHEKSDTQEFKKYFEAAEEMKGEYLAKKEAYETKMAGIDPNWNKPVVPKKNAKVGKKTGAAAAPKKKIAKQKKTAGPKKKIAKQKKTAGPKKKATAKKSAAAAKKTLVDAAEVLQSKAIGAGAPTRKKVIAKNVDNCETV